MQLERREEKGVAVLALSGALDEKRAPEFEKLIKDHVDGGSNCFVLDMTNLETVDSRGMAAVVRSQSLVRRSGGELKLAGVPADVAFLLRSTGFATRVPLFPTVKDALADF